MSISFEMCNTLPLGRFYSFPKITEFSRAANELFREKGAKYCGENIFFFFQILQFKGLWKLNSEAVSHLLSVIVVVLAFEMIILGLRHGPGLIEGA